MLSSIKSAINVPYSWFLATKYTNCSKMSYTPFLTYFHSLHYANLLPYNFFSEMVYQTFEILLNASLQVDYLCYNDPSPRKNLVCPSFILILSESLSTSLKSNWHNTHISLVPYIAKHSQSELKSFSPVRRICPSISFLHSICLLFRLYANSLQAVHYFRQIVPTHTWNRSFSVCIQVYTMSTSFKYLLFHQTCQQHSNPSN